MSLFTVKDIWSIDLNEPNNSFTGGSIAIGNLDNDPVNNDTKIAIGSFSGLLRIVGALQSFEDENVGNEASNPSVRQQTTLLAELQLSSSILQVEVGRFVSGSDKLHLAILHPQKLGVYIVSKLPGQVEHGSQYKVTLLYEHQLKRHAFNMCYGPFGQGKDSENDITTSRKYSRHFICVQSLDGTLSFFEQEVFTLSRYLPGFLLPGPLAYVSLWDSFLTVSSCWNLQCFKYSNLIMSKDESNRQTQETAVGKKLTPEWSFCLGEDCIGNIQVLESKSGSSIVRIIIGTFRHIFCFAAAGELIWCKRLDYPMSSLHSFFHGEEECITVIMSANEPHACYVYNGTTLKWAAKLTFAPVFMGKASVQGIDSGMILLSSDGRLIVGYLGTEPSLFVAPPVQSRDLDYEAAEKELNQLRKFIAESGEQSVVASKDSTVEIKVEFEGQKSKMLETNGTEVMVLIGTIKIACRLRVNDLRITVSTPKPIVCNPETVYIGDIVGRHEFAVEFYPENDATPSDLQCDVYVFYISDNGAPHFVQKCGIKIPLFIVAKPHDHVDKESECKLTFSINKAVIGLTTLYNDFEWGPDITPTSISFRLLDGDKATLMASTKMNTSTVSRYRIQANSVAVIHLIFRDFIERLTRKFGREKSDLSIELVGFENEVPFLNEYCSEIDAHILRRRREIQMKEDLADRAAQLRAVQKRSLLRFRDKNPLPLTQLEILLEGSLDQITDCLNFMEENELEKQKCECRLSGTTKLILELVLIQGNRNPEEFTTLTSALCPYVWHFVEDSGWEESLYSNLSYLKSHVVSPTDFQQLDSSKLKRLIKSMLEKARIASKSIPVISNEKSKDSASSSIHFDADKLVGNEITERMTSARTRATRKMNPVLESIPEPNEEETDLTNNKDETTNVPTAQFHHKSFIDSTKHQTSFDTNDIVVNGVTESQKNDDPADESFWL